MKADITPDDRGELPVQMEPLLFAENSRFRSGLTDLALELATASTGFRRSLPPALHGSLADLVRAMNCYYSNFIEGHNTHPIDIERALNNQYSDNATQRELQLEATAHIAVQQWIDAGALTGKQYFTIEGIAEIHRRLCERIPEELLWVSEPGTGKRVQVLPGQFRTDHVQIGQHVAISPGAVPRFLRRFEEVYARLGKVETILASAAAHHRLLWIHPFSDRNGRVARLTSHALFLEVLDTGGIWSVARGLARQVQEYKSLLARCDQQRRNDLDGRGNLSEEALAEFTRFFLNVCIDQVRFMESLVDPNGLRSRILVWAAEEATMGSLPAHAGRLLEAVLIRGEVPRGETDAILYVGERQARRVVSALIERNVLVAETPRAPLRLNFPATLASRWLPGLFPDYNTGAGNSTPPNIR